MRIDFGVIAAIIGVVDGLLGIYVFIIEGKKDGENKIGKRIFWVITAFAVVTSVYWYYTQSRSDPEPTEVDTVLSDYDSSDSTASSSDVDEEKEKILDGAKNVSYIDVYPENVTYSLSEIDIYVKSDGKILNMRSGPNDSYVQVGQVKNGKQVVKLSASKNDYTYIFDPVSEKYGWVLSKYVR